jgi:hypothetical protein
MTFKYIELCAGAGGMRAGLDAAGWECILAVDKDPDAVAVHRLAHGSACKADVTALTPDDLPAADAWVAGFPCQPFSSSGNRAGFGHHSGNVFEHLARLLQQRKPPLVILENVEGLLFNKSGHTFAVVLRSLTELGYEVDWLLMDLRWFGPPQTRPRLFIVAGLPNFLKTSALADSSGLLPGFSQGEMNAFTPVLHAIDAAWGKRSEGLLSQTEASLRPSIGKARPVGRLPFGHLGHACGDRFVTYDLSGAHEPPPKPNLGTIVAPSFRRGQCIRSGRFYARGGPTKLYLRDEPISHCVGTSLGGAPLFAVPVTAVAKRAAREAFLEHANWHREQGGSLVMRLRPDRAVLLFGPYTSELHEALKRWEAGETRKYKLVGNLVAPICAKTVADLINAQISSEYAVAS